MKLIRKAKWGINISPIEEVKSDNTRVVTYYPEIPLRESKGLIVNTTPVIKEDRRSPLLREVDYRVGSYLNNQEQIRLNTAEGLAGIGTFISPSTYIGPLFRNNGKDYSTNLMSGEGTGNAVGNLVTDIAMFGLPSLLKKGLTPKISKNLRLKNDLKYSNTLPFTEYPKNKQLINIYNAPEYNNQVLGEYMNPEWKEFYENILQPLNDLEKLPPLKSAFVVRPSLREVNWGGFHDFSNHKSYININNLKEGDTSGFHEAVSHFTDRFANQEQWDGFFLSLGKFKPDWITQEEYDDILSTLWKEQRATFNEGRFRLYKFFKTKYPNLKIDLPTFLRLIDETPDEELLKYSLYDINTGKPLNGYAENLSVINPVFSNYYKYNSYFYPIESSSILWNNINKLDIKKLRNQFKNVFGLTGVGVKLKQLNNETNK